MGAYLVAGCLAGKFCGGFGSLLSACGSPQPDLWVPCPFSVVLRLESRGPAPLIDGSSWDVVIVSEEKGRMEVRGLEIED